MALSGDAVLRLRDRLDNIYAGRPADRPEDRAFAAVVDQFDMPAAPLSVVTRATKHDPFSDWLHTAAKTFIADALRRDEHFDR